MIPSYQKTADQIKQFKEMAIIPVGSLEQHGHHLPIHTDIVLAQAYADQLGQQLDAFVLPCLPISTNREQMGFKGSVWMNPDTFYNMLQDIILCLYEQGFTKIVVVPGHGGIFVLPPCIRQINATMNPGLQVAKVELYQFIDTYLGEGLLASTNNLHADELETSLMLHLQPELVQMEKAVDCVPQAKREYLNYASLSCFCPDGVWGEPTLGTAEKGEKVLRRAVALGTQHIQTLFDLMENKKPLGYSRF